MGAPSILKRTPSTGTEYAQVVTAEDALVRIHRGFPCPACDRELSPHDVILADGSCIQLICAGCHLVLLEVEPL
jgi:hypothetical protein